ncbi:ABC transporter ATP-binding protein [Novacetimonas maltaceti]|uniref:Vitamin B12 transport ATP-binding protein BacA n=1 Tax=Novacetimonas maltaceti TaxID=1203393 RepID=A0A2S3W302_9PROT|nr:ABC transporter ATP-binding protein/permease [Novacetimonas maltaceti]POF63226.1 Vitamin B12 transport ATP-binding protein BacA [Novacetimonas maltaceti]PYD60057.1 ABC transporter ATP-binding protein [Novacetimonas maltaceti]
MQHLRLVLKDVWYLTRPYFMSEERGRAWALLLGVLALTFSLVGIDLVQSFARNVYYTALQQRDVKTFLRGLFWYVRGESGGIIPGFFPVAAPALVMGVYLPYLQQMLQLRWRRWLTRRMTAQWLENRTYYRIALVTSGLDAGADNPDQRIQEDINSFVSDTLTQFTSLVTNVVTLFSYAGLLWALSGPLVVLGITIPGYFFWAALLYSIFATWVTHLVGHRLAGLQFLQQRAEADLRYGLVHVRDNAEGIALYRGEAEEKTGLEHAFSAVYDNFLAIMRRTRMLGLLTTGLEVVSGNFALLVGSIRYFANKMTFGTLMQMVMAFSRVQGAMGWFSTSYASLATWHAEVARLATFQRVMDRARAMEGECRVIPAAAGADMVLRDLTVLRPDGTVMLEHVSMTLRHGGMTVISAPSGTGKSTLFRVMAGIWPFVRGEIERPDTPMMFVPQRPYLPVGSLRRAVCYPMATTQVQDTQVRAALAAVGLGRLAPLLDEEAPWGQTLSPGEQQRLAFARILVARPAWVFLDESTSSLDATAEGMLYDLLRQECPGITIVSITHRASLLAAHDTCITLQSP